MQFQSSTQNIFEFLSLLGEGSKFSGNSIVSVAYGHRLGALRLLRKLRQDGKIDYICIDQPKSIYKLIYIKKQKEETDK